MRDGFKPLTKEDVDKLKNANKRENNLEKRAIIPQVLQPMMRKKNFEDLPDVPLEEKITADDWNNFADNVDYLTAEEIKNQIIISNIEKNVNVLVGTNQIIKKKSSLIPIISNNGYEFYKIKEYFPSRPNGTNPLFNKAQIFYGATIDLKIINQIINFGCRKFVVDFINNKKETRREIFWGEISKQEITQSDPGFGKNYTIYYLENCPINFFSYDRKKNNETTGISFISRRKEYKNLSNADIMDRTFGVTIGLKLENDNDVIVFPTVSTQYSTYTYNEISANLKDQWVSNVFTLNNINRFFEWRLLNFYVAYEEPIDMVSMTNWVEFIPIHFRYNSPFSPLWGTPEEPQSQKIADFLLGKISSLLLADYKDPKNPFGVEVWFDNNDTKQIHAVWRDKKGEPFAWLDWRNNAPANSISAIPSVFFAKFFDPVIYSGVLTTDEEKRNYNPHNEIINNQINQYVKGYFYLMSSEDGHEVSDWVWDIQDENEPIIPVKPIRAILEPKSFHLNINESATFKITNYQAIKDAKNTIELHYDKKYFTVVDKAGDPATKVVTALKWDENYSPQIDVITTSPTGSFINAWVYCYINQPQQPIVPIVTGGNNQTRYFDDFPALWMVDVDNIASIQNANQVIMTRVIPGSEDIIEDLTTPGKAIYFKFKKYGTGHVQIWTKSPNNEESKRVDLTLTTKTTIMPVMTSQTVELQLNKYPSHNFTTIKNYQEILAAGNQFVFTYNQEYFDLIIKDNYQLEFIPLDFPPNGKTNLLIETKVTVNDVTYHKEYQVDVVVHDYPPIKLTAVGNGDQVGVWRAGGNEQIAYLESGEVTKKHQILMFKNYNPELFSVSVNSQNKFILTFSSNWKTALGTGFVDIWAKNRDGLESTKTRVAFRIIAYKPIVPVLNPTGKGSQKSQPYSFTVTNWGAIRDSGNVIGIPSYLTNQGNGVITGVAPDSAGTFEIKVWSENMNEKSANAIFKLIVIYSYSNGNETPDEK